MRRYHFEGAGCGYTLTEVERLEDSVEEHENRKRGSIAELSEY